MKTKILRVNAGKPEAQKIAAAAKMLKGGGIVAFPTETVYGLGANVFNPEAVKKIFRAKGRPADNPLIVHIARTEDIGLIAEKIPGKALRLAEKFWPGPLTMVLKKSRAVPGIVTAGLGTVAVRMPKNRVALALIREAGFPIAAPSANISGKPSPTSAAHVAEDFKGKIPLIIDSGGSEIGLESTVVDLSSEKAVLLRPGKISPQQLEKVLGKIIIHGSMKNSGARKSEKFRAHSPGMKYRHYAPEAKIVLVEGKYPEVRKKILERAAKIGRLKKISVISFNANHKYGKLKTFFAGTGKKAAAKKLFTLFREMDRRKIDVVFIEAVGEDGLGMAIMNRIRKAASEKISA